MTARNFNNVTSVGTLTAPASPSDTSMTTTGFTNYPTAPFTATVERNTISEEVVLVTAVNTGTLTVTRGYNGTAAQTHLAGSTVEHTAVALDFTEANAHVNATDSVHGVTGGLVGDEAPQTLLDKTLVSPVLTADVSAGDAVVAYVPEGAEARNLFRGMDPAGDDVAVIDSTGQATFARVQSTGNSETDGNHQVDGNLAVGGTATLTGAVTVTGATTLNGAVTIPAESAASSPVRKSTTDGYNTRLTTAEGTLTAATSAATASVIAKRDASGRLAVANGAASGDVVNKGQMDAADAALSTRVTTLESDTGWVNLSYGSGFAGGQMKYRVRNGFCTATVNAAYAGSYTAGAVVTTLPVGGRPSIQLFAEGGYLAAPVPFDIATTGVITTDNTTAATGIVFTVTFPIG